MAALAGRLGDDPAALLDALLAAGTDFDPWDDYHERLVVAARGLLAAGPAVARLLLRLREALAGDEWPERRITLAFAAAAAESGPAAFARHADPDDLEGRLAGAVRDAESFSARRFALTALCRLRRATPATVDALRWALRDVPAVQADALRAVTYLREVAGGLASQLAAGLGDESAAAAWAVGRALETLGNTETTGAANRAAIVAALAAAIRDPASQREVYTLEGSRIVHQGRLDQLLHQMLVGLAGGGRG